ncbi:MAG: hypothetical protein HY698_22455 [Deltaproteobacteria bacterium]|nr:hypothetical protein [Deltaproteobacteria bacterium]
MTPRDEGPPKEPIDCDDTEVIGSAPEPPVVARLVVEIRSDGSRTIARGAIEDLTLGKRAALQAEGSSPLALAASLAKAMLRAPLLGQAILRAPQLMRRAARGVLPGRGEKKER